MTGRASFSVRGAAGLLGLLIDAVRAKTEAIAKAQLRLNTPTTGG